MNLAEIKTKLGVETLNLSYPKDEQGNIAIDKKTEKPSLWLKHWDNDNRVAIVLHKEVLDKVKADPTMPNLSIKWETKQPVDSTKAAYQMAVIIAHAPADETL